MNERPTPETDAVAAYEGNWDTKALRMTVHARKLERERDEARYEAAMWALQRDEAREQANVMHEQWLSKGRCCENLAEELHEVKQQRDEAIARSKEWSDWCVEYKSELEEAQKDTKILSRRMKTLWDSSEKVCRERDELLKECMQMSIEFGLPPTIRPADGEIRKMINGWKQAMVERDEARDANKKLREVLEWIAERYDDSKPMHQVSMDAYEMSCTARAILQKEETK